MKQPLLPYLAILVLWLSGPGVSGQFKPAILPEKPFKTGEKIKYLVRFGPIVGGNASLVLTQTRHQNHIVYYAVGQGKTVGVTDKLYRVNDSFESYFDMRTLLPHRSVRDVNEGSYKKHEEALFNRESGTIYSTRKDSFHVVPAGVIDMVSLLYYIRSLDYSSIKPGDVIRTVTFFDEELFPFDIRYRGKEEIRTRFGKIRCLRFDPVVEPGRIFDSEDDMTIWFSDDKNLLPVKVRFDLIVGSLKIELQGYENLKYPIVFSKD